MKLIALSLSAALGATLLACGRADDDDIMESPNPPDTTATTTRFDLEIANVGPRYDFLAAGAFEKPFGVESSRAANPGESFRVAFLAPHGSRLSFATMFDVENGWFFATPPEGIALWTADNKPITGDVTSQIQLWDLGAKIEVAATADAPLVGRTVRVTLTHDGKYFGLRVDNASDAGTLSPGVWAVHLPGVGLFAAGPRDPADGLDGLGAEGGAATLAAVLATRVGVVVPLSPGVAAVSSGRAVLFTANTADRGEGLERIAEDGLPDPLLASLLREDGVRSVVKFEVPVGGAMPMPILPGQSYRLNVDATPGDRLFLATMYATSNDWFYAPNEDGIALFDGETPIAKDLSASFGLWDLGTEVNGPIGMDPDQAPFQVSPNTGASEGGAVRSTSDPIQRIRVRIAPQGQLPSAG